MDTLKFVFKYLYPSDIGYLVVGLEKLLFDYGIRSVCSHTHIYTHSKRLVTLLASEGKTTLSIRIYLIEPY